MSKAKKVLTLEVYDNWTYELIDYVDNKEIKGKANPLSIIAYIGLLSLFGFTEKNTEERLQY